MLVLCARTAKRPLQACLGEAIGWDVPPGIPGPLSFPTQRGRTEVSSVWENGPAVHSLDGSMGPASGCTAVGPARKPLTLPPFVT